LRVTRRAREIEAHIAECATCSAAVAEARGLIAASSRILTALDDVPGAVVPKRAAPPRRQWRAAPWVTGIAAALMLAIGVTTFNRRAVQESAPIASPRIETRQATDTVVQTPTAQTAVAAASVRDSGGAPPAPRRVAAAPKAVRAKAPVLERKTALGARRATATQVESPPTAAPAPARDQAMQNVAASEIAAERAMKRGGESPPSEIAAVAGCYRVPTSATVRGDERVASVSAGAVGGAASGRSRSAPAPAARAPVAAAADFAATRAVTLRLDTLRRASGYVVRAAESDSVIGSWTRMGDDSLRVDLSASRRVLLTAKDRVGCRE